MVTHTPQNSLFPPKETSRTSDLPLPETGQPLPSFSTQPASSGTERAHDIPAKFADDFPEDADFTNARRQGNDIIYSKEGHSGSVIKHRDSPQTASRSWANNNPGNIEFGHFSEMHGAIGTDGRFAVFPSAQTGFDAQEALLRNEKYQQMTLSGVIATYAPKKENNVKAYVDYVSKRTGVSADTPISTLSPSDLRNVIYAMAEHEGWKPGEVQGSISPAPQIAEDAKSAHKNNSAYNAYKEPDPVRDMEKQVFGASKLGDNGQCTSPFNAAATNATVPAPAPKTADLDAIFKPGLASAIPSPA